MIGTPLPDVLVGTPLNDVIFGLGGADVLIGLEGNDFLDGGVGIDTMLGMRGNDTYVVNVAADRVIEQSGDGIDLVVSRAATYNLTANVENLILSVGAFNGFGNGLDNVITGNANNNVLFGNGGNDRMFGNGGNDVMNGGSGNDLLDGGAGHDILTGGLGFDTIRFASAPVAANVDTVVGFSHVFDTFELDRSFFPGIGAPGALNPALFKANAAGIATQADDRIIYDTGGLNAGNLYYDSNGNGAGGQHLIAVVAGHPFVNAADFLIIA